MGSEPRVPYSPAAALTLADLSSRTTVSVREFCGLVGYSEGTVYAAIRDGDVPSIRYGRKIRIPARFVLRLLDADDEGAA